MYNLYMTSVSVNWISVPVVSYILLARATHKKDRPRIVAWRVCWNVFTKPLPNNALSKPFTINQLDCESEACSLTRFQDLSHISDGQLFFFNLVCEAIGTAATPGLLYQARVIVKMIVEKQMECGLAGETEVLG
jgi:hypothetical protein